MSIERRNMRTERPEDGVRARGGSLVGLTEAHGIVTVDKAKERDRPVFGTALNDKTPLTVYAAPDDPGSFIRTERVGIIKKDLPEIHVPVKPPDNESPTEKSIGFEDCTFVGFEGRMINEPAWESLFRNDIEGFEGDPEQAAFLMNCMARGRQDIVDDVAGTDIVIPPIKILTNNEELDLKMGWALFTGTLSPKQVIAVTKETIANYSLHDINQFSVLQHESGEEIIGSVLDDWRLAGVEEARHAAFTQVYPEVDQNSSALAVNDNGEYHAQDIEWDALLYKIDYAKARDMHPVTIRTLEKWRDAAAVIRQERGLSTDKIELIRK